MNSSDSHIESKCTLCERKTGQSHGNFQLPLSPIPSNQPFFLPPSCLLHPWISHKSNGRHPLNRKHFDLMENREGVWGNRLEEGDRGGALAVLSSQSSNHYGINKNKISVAYQKKVIIYIKSKADVPSQGLSWEICPQLSFLAMMSEGGRKRI